MADKNIQLIDKNSNNLFPKTKAEMIETTNGGNLGTVEEGAQVNVIESITINGTPATISNKVAALTTITQADLNTKQNNLSASQLESVNSGITAAKIETYDGYVNTIANKANKATTLNGYGITDSYTKTEVENKIAGFISYVEITN